jgi:hypothetical protein
MTNIRGGDTILHVPSGEKWLVAAVSPEEDRLVCCGWPESIAPFSDCQLVTRMPDDQHVKHLKEVSLSSRSSVRSGWASAELKRWGARDE